MNRKYYYLIIICLLLISNFVLLYFFIQKPKLPLNPEGPRRMIIEKLQFDDQQILSYQILIDQHRKEIKENDIQILNLKKELYSYLKSKNNDQKIDFLTTEIGKVQSRIEATHFRHFQQIKALCKPGSAFQF
jgi:periplasmic protein CpxP/Spy